MLPSLHCQGYQEFLRRLEQLKTEVAESHPTQGFAGESFKQVQQLYQETILTLTHEGIEDAIAPRWQSLQTEIHRTMRLLQTDVLFLSASRQAATTQQRQTACGKRIEQLISYCRAILAMSQ